jgi:hypothetical protein
MNGLILVVRNQYNIIVHNNVKYAICIVFAVSSVVIGGVYYYYFMAFCKAYKFGQMRSKEYCYACSAMLLVDLCKSE